VAVEVKSIRLKPYPASNGGRKCGHAASAMLKYGMLLLRLESINIICQL
jgi:hypothetical protein